MNVIDFYKKNENRFVKNKEITLDILNKQDDHNFFKNLPKFCNKNTQPINL